MPAGAAIHISFTISSSASPLEATSPVPPSVPRRPLREGTLHALRDRCERDERLFDAGGVGGGGGKSGVVRNCSVNVVRVHTRRDEGSRGDARWELVSWGDTSHLAGRAEGLKVGFGGTRDST